MHRLKSLIDRGLTATADLWPPIHTAFGWVHRAAHILGTAGIGAATARRQLGGLLGAMTAHRDAAGELATAVDHFVKVSRSYWPGLFHCYAVADKNGVASDGQCYKGTVAFPKSGFAWSSA